MVLGRGGFHDACSHPPEHKYQTYSHLCYAPDAFLTLVAQRCAKNNSDVGVDSQVFSVVSVFVWESLKFFRAESPMSLYC
jgi:hypothetical protein